ncbi:MAG TPA: hypothetical protein VJ579_02675 [Candidatus Paceibacterota bacterium]|nr:hypothetical protein [Candidatus Paceibacterota bacterium]
MPTSEKLPGLCYSEYLTHRAIEQDRKRSLEDVGAEPKRAEATNQYAAHRQYAFAVTAFLNRRVYVRDAYTERSASILGNFFVHGIKASEEQDKALLHMHISPSADINAAIWVSVHPGTYIMSCK